MKEANARGKSVTAKKESVQPTPIFQSTQLSPSNQGSEKVGVQSATAANSLGPSLTAGDRKVLEEQAQSADRSGDFKKAISLYQQLANVHRTTIQRPAYCFFVWHIAKCYFKMGETSKSVELYEEIEPIYSKLAPGKLSQFPNLRTVIRDYAQAL